VSGCLRISSHVSDQPILKDSFQASFLLLLAPDSYLPCEELTVGEFTSDNPPGVGVLIGRDVLSRCLLVYDGRAGTFTIEP
jgi:hypothetical protein